MNTSLLPTSSLSPFERLNQMMEDVFPTPPLLAPRTWFPPVDIKETEKELIFLVELPGMLRENIEAELVGDTLILRGKREEENVDETKGWVRRERTYGKFQRSFRLETPVDADKIKAEYTNGLLTVSIPKIEATKPKKISIKP